ncbi:unnamed protein product [Lactuca virosa]|uniref:Uncharacterized protein n=1 Tax=Lactuca virosa TaxID=75947 RepID=A0AAU9PFR1_9ASTR|nr:unnamed protein product [Lactuca virosa]
MVKVDGTAEEEEVGTVDMVVQCRISDDRGETCDVNHRRKEQQTVLEPVLNNRPQKNKIDPKGNEKEKNCGFIQIGFDQTFKNYKSQCPLFFLSRALPSHNE